MDDKERNWFISRMEDLADRADQTGYMIFSDFLDGYQLSLLRDMQRHLTTEVTFYGGYEDAERRMASFYPSFLQVQTEDFPIEALLITPKAPQFLTKAPGHRDYLGALMGLGIKREKLGDILLQEQGAVVFVSEDMASYIQEGVTSVAPPMSMSQCGQGDRCEAPEGKRILDQPRLSAPGCASQQGLRHIQRRRIELDSGGEGPEELERLHCWG